MLHACADTGVRYRCVMLHACADTGVPDPVVLKGHQMNELNVFAELKLSFSAELTNTLRVDANLHQLHDKTSSASVQFDVDFLVSYWYCSQPSNTVASL